MKKDVHEELKQIAPKLSKLTKRTTSDVPSGYFEEVEDLLVKQFSFIPMENSGMITPEGYFDKFEANVLSKVEINKYSYKNISLFNRSIISLNLKTAVAASFILLVSSIAFFSLSTEINEGSEVLAVQNQYIDYIEENADEYDINLLIENELINEEDLQDLTVIDDSFDSNSDIFMDTEINF